MRDTLHTNRCIHIQSGTYKRKYIIVRVVVRYGTYVRLKTIIFTVFYVRRFVSDLAAIRFRTEPEVFENRIRKRANSKRTGLGTGGEKTENCKNYLNVR